MKKITRPKFVKKANQWVITIIDGEERGKKTQRQKWFSTEEEALDVLDISRRFLDVFN